MLRKAVSKSPALVQATKHRDKHVLRAKAGKIAIKVINHYGGRSLEGL
jgi:hypothetical protein